MRTGPWTRLVGSPSPCCHCANSRDSTATLRSDVFAQHCRLRILRSDVFAQHCRLRILRSDVFAQHCRLRILRSDVFAQHCRLRIGAPAPGTLGTRGSQWVHEHSDSGSDSSHSMTSQRIGADAVADLSTQGALTRCGRCVPGYYEYYRPDGPKRTTKPKPGPRACRAMIPKLCGSGRARGRWSAELPRAPARAVVPTVCTSKGSAT